MKLILVIIAIFFTLSCTVVPKDKIMVTGKRFSKNNIKIVKTQTVGDLLKSLPKNSIVTIQSEELTIADYGKLKSFKDCQKLLAYLESTDLTVTNLKDNSLTLVSKTEMSLDLNFENGGCLMNSQIPSLPHTNKFSQFD